MKNYFLLVIPCVILSLFSSTTASAYLFYPQEYYTISYQPGDYVPSNQALNNPYRGWYHIYGYALSDSQPVNPQQLQETAAKDFNQLVLLEINLRNYPNAELSEIALSQLESILLTWKDSGKQLILRFLYDWDGKAKETEPTNISIIKRHMEQTGAVVNKFADCVFMMQGIYVGNCGEMNNSNYMSLENMRELAAHLDSVIDPAIYLSVRTPEHYRIISRSTEPPSAENAFSGDISTRTGLFNDGMLGSDSDLGTYGESPFAPTEDFTGKGTRNEEIAFQNILCDYVPNGGEVVLDNAYNDFSNALTDLRKMHVSYLDCGYDLAVLDKWHNSVYSGNDCFNNTDGYSYNETDCFDGIDGYSYIGEHLGYRYSILSSECSFDTFRNAKAALTVTLENSGFSVSYRPFISMITILHEDGSVCDTIWVDTDVRFWQSGEQTTWNVPLDIRAYRDGAYQIYYRLYDPKTHRQISLANNIPTSNYGYYIGDFTVKSKKAISKTSTVEEISE